MRVVVDEVHGPLTYPGHRFTPYLTVPGTESAFAVLSAAKAFNIAGLKAALVIPGSSAAEELGQAPEIVRFGASAFGLLAHTAAYRHGGAWLDAQLDGLAANRRTSAASWRSTCPGSDSGRRRPPTSPGWTAGLSAWSPIPAPCSSSAGASR